MISSIAGGGGFDPSALQAKIQERIQERFSTADADGSGGLSLEEFSSSAPSFATQDKVEARFAEALSTSDADGNGELSQEEFTAFLETKRNQFGGGRPPGGGFGGPGGAGGPGGGGVTSLIEELLAEDDEDETSGTTTDPADALAQILANAAEESEDVFALLDTDDSGDISDAEYQAGVEKVQNEFFNTLLSAQEEQAA